MADPGYSLPVYPNAISGTYGQQHDQYLRKWTLTLGSSGSVSPSVAGPGLPTGPQGSLAGGAGMAGGGLVITTETPGYDFRMVFRIRHADSETPGTAEIRIYNLSDTTAANVIAEFDTVQLQAGYQSGHFGTIFQGQIKQYKRGRESAVDSYLDIFAADGDLALHYSLMGNGQGRTLPAGSSFADVQRSIANDLVSGSGGTVTQGQITQPTVGGVLPRSVVQYGMAVDEAREYARTTGTTWSIQNGQLQVMSSTAYKPGDRVVINSGTGMIGAPEVTQDGIYVTCLLNPNLYVRGLVQLDNRSLNQYFLPGGQPIAGQLPSFGPQGEAVGPTSQRFGVGPPQFFASTAWDGVYMIICIDHIGDTRGQPWYSQITCLAVDPTNPPQASVIPGGDWQMPSE
jgi:hypothetical protein